MLRILFALSFLLLSQVTLAHGGGLDRCGGHHDRKQGGYHIHNVAKYCACHPDKEGCKPKDRNPSQQPDDEPDDDSSKGAAYHHAGADSLATVRFEG